MMGRNIISRAMMSFIPGFSLKQNFDQSPFPKKRPDDEVTGERLSVLLNQNEKLLLEERKQNKPYLRKEIKSMPDTPFPIRVEMTDEDFEQDTEKQYNRNMNSNLDLNLNLNLNGVKHPDLEYNENFDNIDERDDCDLTPMESMSYRSEQPDERDSLLNRKEDKYNSLLSCKDLKINLPDSKIVYEVRQKLIELRSRTLEIKDIIEKQLHEDKKLYFTL